MVLLCNINRYATWLILCVVNNIVPIARLELGHLRPVSFPHVHRLSVLRIEIRYSIRKGLGLGFGVIRAYGVFFSAVVAIFPSLEFAA